MLGKMLELTRPLIHPGFERILVFAVGRAGFGKACGHPVEGYGERVQLLDGTALESGLFIAMRKTAPGALIV